MTSTALRVPPTSIRALGVALALGLVAPAVWAQQTQAPAPPPPPTPVTAPPLRLPAQAAVPPRPAARAAAASAPPTPALGAPAPVRPGVPPDSMRPRPVASPAVAPANAVARCRDGTFVVPPADASACASHRGVGVVLPAPSAPQRPLARPLPMAAASRGAAAADVTPPAGATMRCKDGSWLTGAPAAGRCGANGGTAVILSAARPTPPAPRPRRP